MRATMVTMGNAPAVAVGAAAIPMRSCFAFTAPPAGTERTPEEEEAAAPATDRSVHATPTPATVASAVAGAVAVLCMAAAMAATAASAVAGAVAAAIRRV